MAPDTPSGSALGRGDGTTAERPSRRSFLTATGIAAAGVAGGVFGPVVTPTNAALAASALTNRSTLAPSDDRGAPVEPPGFRRYRVEELADTSLWDITRGDGALFIAGENLVLSTAAGSRCRIARDAHYRLNDGGAVIARVKRDENLSRLEFAVVCVDAAGAKRTYQSVLNVRAMPVGKVFAIVYPLAAAANQPATASAGDGRFVTGFEIEAGPMAGAVTSLEIESVHFAEGDDRGTVSFQFDDGSAETYASAYPILTAAGYRGAVAVDHTTVGRASRCTLAQLREMYDTGWAILGHHSGRLAGQADAAQNAVHRAAKDFHRAQGWTRGGEHWVWTGGRTPAADAIASKYWKTRRGRESTLTVATPAAFDHSDPCFYRITKTTTVADVKAKVDAVDRNGGALVLVFHRILPAPLAAEDWSVANFRAVVNYCVARGMPGSTYDEVFGDHG